MSRFAIFCHSLVSDWNHGNAHFLRGVCNALMNRGHSVTVYEPSGAWSLTNLKADYGEEPVRQFHAAFPQLKSIEYDLQTFDLDRALGEADVVVVHEWSDHDLVRSIGAHRASGGRFTLLFHDTHHRSVTEPTAMAAYDLRHYDGVLAFGESVRQQYLRNGWASRVWTWHEAADTTVFYPRGERPPANPAYDLVWVGNWGDEERTAELREFLLEPVRELGLNACVHGVRYPPDALAALRAAGIEYKGWLPNYRAPELFADAKFTVHVPRGPYAGALPGIPTIRVFEALACGIPLISAPWTDSEHLFSPGTDFLVARDGAEMTRHMRAILDDPEAANRRALHGKCTVERRHTCFHRAMELETICGELR
jgi:spore maturation protein CgeB